MYLVYLNIPWACLNGPYDAIILMHGILHGWLARSHDIDTQTINATVFPKDPFSSLSCHLAVSMVDLR